ncbi:hypothetical protein [Burkholderia pseudomultivorans]|uniref:hypothetical protein n=1 Tax=Burkholderia pseudomultivorans TaxID=1207504 RepID=UPI001583235A|nr:hypothetical protein [Burkholderia pseudomultivorans]
MSAILNGFAKEDKTRILIDAGLALTRVVYETAISATTDDKLANPPSTSRGLGQVPHAATLTHVKSSDTPAIKKDPLQI